MKNRPSPLVTTLANAKGGVGKTTLTIAIARRLSERHRTLIVEMDKMGNSSMGLGADKRLEGSATLLTGGTPAYQKITETLDLLCGNSDLEDPNIRRMDPEALADVVRTLPYDYILIDSSAGSHELQKLSVVAAHRVLIPMDADDCAIASGKELIGDLAKRHSAGRTGADKWAFIANKIDVRRSIDRGFVEMLQSGSFAIPTFIVHQNTAFPKAKLAQRPFSQFVTSGDPVGEIDQVIEWINT